MSLIVSRVSKEEEKYVLYLLIRKQSFTQVVSKQVSTLLYTEYMEGVHPTTVVGHVTDTGE